MAWQPVETAPGDFVECLVYAPRHRHPVFTAERVYGEWTRTNGGHSTPRNDFYGDGDLGVTHWQPLPQPPE